MKNGIARHYFVAHDKVEDIGLNATVVIVDANYWDKNRDLNDGLSNESDVVQLLEDNGFYELQENVFESADEFDSYLLVREKMLSLGFEEKPEIVTI